MCRFVGRMYWPNVTTSTSALRSSTKRQHTNPRSGRIHACQGLTSERILNLAILFAKPKHHARLGDNVAFAPDSLGLLQYTEALSKRRPSITHIWRQSLHRLDIMRKHIKPTLRDRPHAIQLAPEIARQRLDQHSALALFLDQPNRLRNMRSTAVWQVVAVNNGENNVAKPPTR